MGLKSTHFIFVLPLVIFNLLRFLLVFIFSKLLNLSTPICAFALNGTDTLKKYLFFYLAVSGLSCSPQDPHFILRDLTAAHRLSRCGVWAQ